MSPYKTLLVLVTLAGALALPSYVPAVAQVYHWDIASAKAVWDMPVKVAKPEVSEAKVLVIEDLRAKPGMPPPEPVEASHLFDPQHELDHFYEALRARGPHDMVRVVHFGDSPTTADLVTGDVRAMLQREFGDAGTGFTLITKPWAWYNHRGVEMGGSKWKTDIAGGTMRDGWFVPLLPHPPRRQIRRL